MRPDERDLDDEIRGHLALSVKDRIDRGEAPDAARRAALEEFGYVPSIRDSMRQVWYSRWFDAAADFWQDMRVGLRSLLRAKGLAATVVVTLALGIGANAAIFSVVRGVLLRPLVNRGEDRLIYIGQSAPGLGTANSTFSVPEIEDFKSRATTISAFGDFSTIGFTMVGLGDARVVKAGVVSGSFFDVMGLQPVLGRLIEASDDGPDAASVAVLTHRFWTDSLESDPSVIGKVIQLGANNTTVVGVLEPSVPYPADTEVIANVVTSSHHLDATMVTERTHRMTELFGRLAIGASVEDARADLIAVHAAMMRDHPGAYPASAGTRITVRLLRDQITAPARTILLILVTAAGLVFVIACSNVANLILARSLRREGELAVRAALGASHGALRRTLLAESLVLCGAGAVLGVVLAHPLLAVVARFAARFSVRAVEVTVDNSLLGVGAGLAIAAAVLLGVHPAPPIGTTADGSGRAVAPGTAAGAAIRTTPGTNRRLRAFAMTQIAFSFVLLAGAGTLLSSLLALQTADTGIDLRQVLALDLPTPSISLRDAKEMAFYQDLTRRIDQLPGVEGVALGTTVPWRDAGRLSVALQYTVEGHAIAPGQEYPRAKLRAIAPGFFAVLGVPMIAGRDFTDHDSAESEPVVIVSESVANRLFAGRDAVNQIFWWTDPLFDKAATAPHRRRGEGRGRRAPGPATVPDDLSPGAADRRRRPVVRPRGGRPVLAGLAAAETDSRDLAKPASGTRRDPGGRPHRGVVAKSAQRARAFRIRRGRAADRDGGRRRRPRLLGQRPDP